MSVITAFLFNIFLVSEAEHMRCQRNINGLPLSIPLNNLPQIKLNFSALDV